MPSEIFEIEHGLVGWKEGDGIEIYAEGMKNLRDMKAMYAEMALPNLSDPTLSSFERNELEMKIFNALDNQRPLNEEEKELVPFTERVVVATFIDGGFYISNIFASTIYSKIADNCWKLRVGKRAWCSWKDYPLTRMYVSRPGMPQGSALCMSESFEMPKDDWLGSFKFSDEFNPSEASMKLVRIKAPIVVRGY